MKVYCGDSRDIIPTKISHESIDLVFTSPPYNANVEYDNYDDNLSDDEYLRFLHQIIEYLEPKIKEGGHLILNLPPMVNRNPPKPYAFHLVSDMEKRANLNKTQLRLIGLKVWWKKESGKNHTAIGSRYNKPYPLDDTEFLLIWRKGYLNRNGIPGEVPDKEMKDHMIRSWVLDSSPLEIRPESIKKNRKGHNAVFPVELPKRILKIFTRRGEVVLDPFAGTGKTMNACKQLDRSCIAIDISPKYCKLIENIARQKSLVEILA